MAAMDLRDPPRPEMVTDRWAVRWRCLPHASNLWTGEVRADYPSNENRLIEDVWVQWKHFEGPSEISLEDNNWYHVLDFEDMTQANLDTTTSRPIRRILIESD